MGFLQLTLVLRLRAAQVEERRDGVRERRLEAVIGAKVSEEAVIVPDVLIDPPGDQVFRAQLSYSRRKRRRTGLANSKSTIGVGKPVTSQVR